MPRIEDRSRRPLGPYTATYSSWKRMIISCHRMRIIAQIVRHFLRHRHPNFSDLQHWRSVIRYSNRLIRFFTQHRDNFVQLVYTLSNNLLRHFAAAHRRNLRTV